MAVFFWTLRTLTNHDGAGCLEVLKRVVGFNHFLLCHPRRFAIPTGVLNGSEVGYITLLLPALGGLLFARHGRPGACQFDIGVRKPTLELDGPQLIDC